MPRTRLVEISKRQRDRRWVVAKGYRTIVSYDASSSFRPNLRLPFARQGRMF